MIYQEWLERWLEHYIKPTSKLRTYSLYSSMVRLHISPHLGRLKLGELTPFEIQCFVTELSKSGNKKTGKGLSSNTVNSIITVIQSSLKTAYLLELIPEPLAEKIKRPTQSEKRIDSFTVSEEKQIIREIFAKRSIRLYGVVICLYTGLRLGELLALEWSDVDFVKGEIHISKTCYYTKTESGSFGRVTGSPKTQYSLRTIPIPDALIKPMKELKKTSKSEFVMSNGQKPIAFRSYQRSFESLLKKLELPHRGFHALRHTFATRALECGMDVKTLSEVLGHKNATVTLNRYAHSMYEHKKDMMNMVGKLF